MSEDQKKYSEDVEDVAGAIFLIMEIVATKGVRPEDIAPCLQEVFSVAENESKVKRGVYASLQVATYAVIMTMCPDANESPKG